MTVIALDKVTKRYGQKTVLKDYSLEIKQGELVAVMGPSGCGKSTLLNIIGLLESIDNGHVFVNGYVNPRPSSLLANMIMRRHINYLYQNSALVDEKTVEYNLRLALEIQRDKNKNKELAMDEALERVNLSGYRRAKIFELSAGEQQRVAVARAWLKPCDIILADEPTGSLDPQNRDIIVGLIKEFHEQGKTILIVTHDPAVGRECQRVVKFS